MKKGNLISYVLIIILVIFIVSLSLYKGFVYEKNNTNTDSNVANVK